MMMGVFAIEVPVAGVHENSNCRRNSSQVVETLLWEFSNLEKNMASSP
jgi:hypothetical protein